MSDNSVGSRTLQISLSLSLSLFLFKHFVWKSDCHFRSSQRMFSEKAFSEISKNSMENTCARVSFLIKLQAKALKLIEKDIPTKVFFCEFWEISKNTSWQNTSGRLLMSFDIRKTGMVRLRNSVKFLNSKGPQNCSFIIKKLQHRFFPVNFVNYPRTPLF